MSRRQPCVWVIDDERSIRWILEKALAKAGFQTQCFERADEALGGAGSAAGEARPDVIISDIRMPGMDGLALLDELRNRCPDIPVIIMTAHSDLDSAVSAIQGGAFEYLPKPFEIDQAISVVERALANGRDPSAVAEPELPDPPSDIIGEAPAMQEVFRAIGRLSNSHISVLINGESGTGKELVAQALHQHSPRRNHPFVALNMAAIPHELVDSELFGHERGAFTGASNSRIGRFQQADGGTLFLDEIGDMPPETQTRLLRVLSDGEFYRVGGHEPVRVDVRIIAATHQDLEQLVARQAFREDLFHRLNVIRIHIPCLKDRVEDIPALAQHFLAKASAELAEEPKTLSPDVLEYLRRLPWPGNVRQLENTCRWISVMATGKEVLVEDLPPELQRIDPTERFASSWDDALKDWLRQKLQAEDYPAGGLLETILPRFERSIIETTLAYTGGRRKEAAKILGWGRNTLTRKIKSLSLDHLGDSPGE